MTLQARLEGLVSGLATAINSDRSRLSALETATASSWGSQTVLSQDFREPASLSNPSWDEVFGGYLFAHDASETVMAVIQLPSSYKEGTNLQPYLNWSKSATGTGDVVWKLEYKIARVGEQADGNWSQLVSSSTISEASNNGTVSRHLVTDLGSITGATLGIHDILAVRMTRVHDDNNDTYTSDARMMSLQLFHEVDRIGSSAEWMK